MQLFSSLEAEMSLINMPILVQLIFMTFCPIIQFMLIVLTLKSFFCFSDIMFAFSDE